MVSLDITSVSGFDTLYTRAGEFKTLTFYICGSARGKVRLEVRIKLFPAPVKSRSKARRTV